RLSEMLGGTITARSSIGHGSAFLVTITAGRLEKGAAVRDGDLVGGSPSLDVAPGPSDETSLAGCRLLLAEDGPDNQRLIGHLLRKAGAAVTIAENGRVAVDLALAAR